MYIVNKKDKIKQNAKKTSLFKLRTLLILLSPFFISLLAQNAFAYKQLKLFYVENSLITSKAVYAINLNDNYQITKKKPMYNYWLRPNGSTRPVTWFENKIAYGILYQKIKSKNTIELALSQYPEVKIIATITGKKAVTYFIINNTKYLLEKLFAKAHEGLFFPSVDYVEIIGYDILSKKRVVKRIRTNSNNILEDHID